ncbi:MAG: RluA family pseudouridine synthase [Treponema sp.]|jgi:23S rRNA pseudouridine955/2504/2580 synthase|nr:RluA family pseudouridine synthase [Treponema sp.]
MATEKELIAGTDDEGRRLDRILRRAFPGTPLSVIYRLLRKGRVTVNGVPGEASLRIAAGARIRVREDAASPPVRGPVPPQAEGTPPGLCILREGDGLLLVNKPAGLAVHRPDRRQGKAPSPCLDGLVRAYLRDKLPPSLSFRPGPLHRLDQVSSGIIAFSASLAGARLFSALMRERRLRKTYLALADGRIETAECWEDALFRDRERRKTAAALGGPDERHARPARTRVFPLAVHPPYSLIALEIETGRTHQIRSQAGFHGHPLSGDRKYGGSFQPGGLLLHAFSLSFPPDVPLLGSLRGETVSAPLPKPFLRRIREIFGTGLGIGGALPLNG